MERYETTEKDFTIWQEHCLAWANWLGLNDWSIEFGHREIKEDDEYFYFAQTTTHLSQKLAHIDLNTVVYTDDINKDLRNTSLHEVLHILLSDIQVIALERHNKVFVDNLIHDVINRLCNLLLRVQNVEQGQDPLSAKFAADMYHSTMARMNRDLP